MKIRDQQLWRKSFNLLIIMAKGALDNSKMFPGMKITIHLIYEGTAVA